MISNIIIGKRSFVSKSLKRNNKNNIILSINDLLNKSVINEINNYKKINLVFNNFYPSSKLNLLSSKDYEEFKRLSLEPLLDLFKHVDTKKNK